MNVKKKVTKLWVMAFVVSFLVVLGTVNAFAGEVWMPKADMAVGIHSLGTDNTGKMVVEYDITPLLDSINGALCYFDTDGTPVSSPYWGAMPIAIRLDATGIFDVRKGGAYAKDAEVKYEKDKKYHVKAEIDITAQTYSVWVTPPGAAEVQIAKDYGFRTGALPIDDLGKVWLRCINQKDNQDADDHYKVENHIVYKFGSSPAASEPAKPANPRTGDAGMMIFIATGAIGGVSALVMLRKKK